MEKITLMYFLFSFLLILLLIPFILAFLLYFFRSNSKLEVNLSKVFLINYIESNKEKSSIIFEILLRNNGLFHAIVLDIIPYLNPPYLNYFKLVINNFSNTYFDTIIIKKGKEFKFYCVFILKDYYNLAIKDLQNLYFSINILYYDLKPLRNLYKEFSLKNLKIIERNLPSELENLFKSFYHNQEKEEIKILDKSDELKQIYCLKTPIITHFDTEEKLADLIIDGIKLLKDKKISGKILIAIAESLVAIIQNRAFSIYSINTNFLSELFNHYFNEDSSLSSSYALTKVIQEIGFIRFYVSIIAGMLGKIFKKSGWFYVLAGRKAAAVDDAGGTIRPYDKYVVLAPKDADLWAINFKNKLLQKLQINDLKNNDLNNDLKNIDLDVFVVDANDLGKVDILGTTNKNINNFVIQNLKNNPQGNDDQQTPIVFIIKN
ncbi:MAG: hypothetical protein ACPL1F_00730 [bacterium]